MITGGIVVTFHEKGGLVSSNRIPTAHIFDEHDHLRTNLKKSQGVIIHRSQDCEIWRTPDRTVYVLAVCGE